MPVKHAGIEIAYAVNAGMNVDIALGVGCVSDPWIFTGWARDKFTEFRVCLASRVVWIRCKGLFTEGGDFLMIDCRSMVGPSQYTERT